MKKLLYLAGVILFTAMMSSISCKKDNVDDPYIDNPLVGKWAGVYERVTTYLNNTFYSEQTADYNPGDIMQILSNGSGKFYANNEVSGTFKWKVEAGKFIITYSSGESTAMVYVISNSTLTLSFSDSEGTGNYVFRYEIQQVFTRM
jgi:hypothetical protein